MYKYLLAFFLLFPVSVFGDTGGIYHEEIVSTLPTDAKCASGDGEVLIIDEDSDWSQINDVGKTIFCVNPGVYDVDLDLTRKGTAEARRFIRYYKAGETETTHPVNMDAADQASVSRMYFLSNTEYWTVDRIVFRDVAEKSPVRTQPGGGNNIILNRLLVEDSNGTLIAPGGDFNVVQNSVLRNSGGQVGFDDLCLHFYGDDYKLIGNEVYNCIGDNLQISNGAEGGLVADNELYLTPALYTDCLGNLDPDGLCMCTENALDIKGGALVSDTFPFSESEQLLITGNVLWGFNRDDDSSGNECGTGAGNLGIAMVFHGGVVQDGTDDGHGVRFENNVITSGENNINSIGIIAANPNSKHYSFINNLLYDLNYAVSIPPAKSTLHEWYYNTWINAGITLTNLGGDDLADWLCNVFMNTEENGLSGIRADTLYDYNAYFNYEKTHVTNNNDYSSTHDSESKNEMYCWTKNKITNPTAVCVPLASTSDYSPHAALCNAPAETATRGVDDVTQLTRIKAGFVAPYLQRTIEAEDSAALTYNFVAPVNDIYQFWFKATAADADSNSLSYSVGGRGSQIVRFAYPNTKWNKGAVNLNLTAGMHTLTVIKREAGIVIDKMIVTNNPDFTSP